MSFSIERDDVMGAVQRLRASQRASAIAAAEGVQIAADISERDLKGTALNAGPPVKRGLFWVAPPRFGLGVRSGVTAASVTSQVTRSGDTHRASVGSPLKHVLTNEVGGTLTAKSGGALAIPTIHASTPSGDISNRFSGLRSLRDARTKSGRPLFVFRGRKRGTSGAWLAGMEGQGAGTVVRDRRSGRFKRGGRLTLYFLLRSVVNIPARYTFRHARRRVEPQIQEAIGERLTVKVEGAMR